MTSRSAHDSEALPDRQALATILQTLKKHNLKATEETLLKEMKMSDPSATGHASASTASQPRLSDAEPAKYESSYASLMEFVEKSLDLYRSELSLVLYPVFVHMYLDLIFSCHPVEARSFFAKYRHKQETIYEEELLRFKSITSLEHMMNNDLVETFRKNKFTIRISSDSFQCLVKSLQASQNTLILNVINQFLNLDVFDGTPRTMVDIRATSGALDGEASAKANKAKVLYGIPRDPDIAAALAELDEEESENSMEDEKPKKKKIKRDSLGIFSAKKGKSATTPNAPALNRIPLPKLRDCEQAAKFTAFKESAKCISLAADKLPSICFYTLLNTHNGLNAVSMSDDSSLLAGSFSDSIVRLWTLTPRKLCALKSPAQMQQVTLAAEDVMQRIVDTSTGSEVRHLMGHSGPVYSTSFNADNSFLISGSGDGTVRLWSLQTFTTLVCFKGHNYPVWGVEFSPMSFYFVTASHDRTARVWRTDSIQPLRIMAGHLSDVDCCKWHPNGNYIATGSSDRSVRLWDVLNGQCVRIFTGHKGAIHALAFTPDGKYLASSGLDKRVLVWDISSAALLCELRGHSSAVYQLAFSRDGSILASGGTDCCIKLWDVASFEELGRSMQAHKCLLGSYRTKSTPVHCLHFTRKNLLLAAGPFTE